ncbi:uncharacterized protein LOC117124821 [Anneissia japonica]|uniref:uncharacterized protein LOC117124821 n=1 Tax=Anneissia japonica TaxID=1529436 RepID=UPI001425A415|nr:uncharacterized protein LOC117124821 [Anneissia japonica]
MAVLIRQMFTSFYQYVRAKARLLSGYREQVDGGMASLETDPLFNQEIIQEALLELAGVTDVSSLRPLLHKSIIDLLDNVSDSLVYIIDTGTGQLMSLDGMGGVQHYLPNSGIVQDCIKTSMMVIKDNIAKEDPLTGLAPSCSMLKNKDVKIHKAGKSYEIYFAYIVHYRFAKLYSYFGF